MNEQCISKDLKERVEKERQPGEQVEWLGMPVPRFFSSGALAAFLVGILFTIFSILWALGYASQKKIGPVLPLFIASPFLIIKRMNQTGSNSGFLHCNSEYSLH